MVLRCAPAGSLSSGASATRLTAGMGRATPSFLTAEGGRLWPGLDRKIHWASAKSQCGVPALPGNLAASEYGCGRRYTTRQCRYWPRADPPPSNESTHRRRSSDWDSHQQRISHFLQTVLPRRGSAQSRSFPPPSIRRSIGKRVIADDPRSGCEYWVGFQETHGFCDLSCAQRFQRVNFGRDEVS